MVFEDNLDGVAGLDYTYEKRLSPERVQEYHQLISDAGVQSISAHIGQGTVVFLVAASGSPLGASTSKGFFYSRGAVADPVVDSLDDSCFSPGQKQESCGAYRHLDGGWWLFRYESG
jgi:hypothetical protein